ncbi:hypothetical protein CAOG_009831 [Capsaspora owczarzaki ATCC 30864]|uniref:Secreted protein n=1 Tax=Capsaspora owczarzaki (strain ATCC 30864) TaxID=595528 RepID=A0A0D2WSY3_CAPO3|nr:hypothetical protein CAOG_009831 [Capsaspora owczarzaki ATCC 30864]
MCVVVRVGLSACCATLCVQSCEGWHICREHKTGLTPTPGCFHSPSNAGRSWRFPLKDADRHRPRRRWCCGSLDNIGERAMKVIWHGRILASKEGIEGLLDLAGVVAHLTRCRCSSSNSIIQWICQ